MRMTEDGFEPCSRSLRHTATHSSSDSTVAMTNCRRLPEDDVGVVTSRGRTESSISFPRSLRTVMYCKASRQAVLQEPHRGW